MRFYTGSQFPADYRNNIFVAEHGSWNRSKKSGYQVARVVLDAQGRVLRQEPFVQGWLQVDAAGRESVLGRPADVLVLPDGSLLISDDLGGAIYPCATGPERRSGPSDELASVLQPKPPQSWRRDSLDRRRPLRPATGGFNAAALALFAVTLARSAIAWRARGHACLPIWIELWTDQGLTGMTANHFRWVHAQIGVLERLRPADVPEPD